MKVKQSRYQLCGKRRKSCEKHPNMQPRCVTHWVQDRLFFFLNMEICKTLHTHSEWGMGGYSRLAALHFALASLSFHWTGTEAHCGHTSLARIPVGSKILFNSQVTDRGHKNITAQLLLGISTPLLDTNTDLMSWQYTCLICPNATLSALLWCNKKQWSSLMISLSDCTASLLFQTSLKHSVHLRVKWSLLDAGLSRWNLCTASY